MAKRSRLDPDGLDELIGAIYDCVIDSSRWHDTIDRIRHRYRFYNAILSVSDAVSNETVMHVAVRVPEAMLRVIETDGPYILDVWGGWERVSAVPLEEPIVNSQLMGRRNWDSNPYYQHFMVPQGIDDALAIVLARDKRTVGNLAFGRHHSAPPLTETEIDELRILAPHLRRAVVISRMLETTMATAATFAVTLDTSPAGVVLVDRERHIVHANRVANAMLEARDPIANTSGEVELVDEVVPGTLRRAIETAGDTTAGSAGMGVPARRLDGRPLTAQVMPLERRRGAKTPASAVAAIFVGEAASGPPNLRRDPQRAVRSHAGRSAHLHADRGWSDSQRNRDAAQHFFSDGEDASGEDLSKDWAEQSCGVGKTSARCRAADLMRWRVFTLVVSGQSLDAIGAQLQHFFSYGKMHPARIYQETRQSSRLVLVRLAQDVAPPV